MDLALNNQQWLIYHKTKPNQTKVKITAGLEFELAYVELADENVIHYTTETARKYTFNPHLVGPVDGVKLNS